MKESIFLFNGTNKHNTGGVKIYVYVYYMYDVRVVFISVLVEEAKGVCFFLLGFEVEVGRILIVFVY